MNPPRYVRCPFGVFELRWRRKPILHRPAGRIEHDYPTSEVLNYAYRSEEGWRVIDAAEARRIMEAWKGDIA